MQHSIEFSIFLIFTSAAIFATVALYARQAMIVAYILLGLLLGPWGVALITDAKLISEISNIGIIFLLYLLGLDLLPQQLWKMLREALVVTLTSSAIFFILGFIVGVLFGYEYLKAVLIGSIMMFSSTIIGLKLLPTSILHHKHTGQIIISVLPLASSAISSKINCSFSVSRFANISSKTRTLGFLISARAIANFCFTAL